MPNYKDMYFTLMRETSKALDLLIDAQKACEELYINSDDAELVLLPKSKSDTE